MLMLPLLLLQMHQGLDIAISDEASSTVIHVRGPVSARMCDVGCVFDKLGECQSAVVVSHSSADCSQPRQAGAELPTAMTALTSAANQEQSTELSPSICSCFLGCCCLQGSSSSPAAPACLLPAAAT